MEPIAYFNGEFLPQSRVHLGINDAGFVWGATVTDLVRTFRHQFFRLDAHLIRFRNSAKLARVPLEGDEQQLAFIAQELVRHNAKLIEPTQDLCLCMFATPGPIGYYLGEPGGPGDRPPTLCMHTFPVPFERYVGLIRKGAILRTQADQISHTAVPRSIKHRSRLPRWMAERTLREQEPEATVLDVDESTYVCEASSANFVIVSDGHLITPRTNDYALSGISLMVVEEIASEIGLSYREVDLRLAYCLIADEAMLSCTSYCLAPVSSINGKPIPWPGPVFQQLIAAWNRKVGLDIWGQICSEADRAAGR